MARRVRSTKVWEKGIKTGRKLGETEAKITPRVERGRGQMQQKSRTITDFKSTMKRKIGVPGNLFL